MSLIASRGYAAPGVEEAHARARELCQKIGAAPQLLPVLFGLSGYYGLRAELQTARELGEQALTLAQNLDDSLQLMQAHLNLGIALFWLGEPTQSQEQLEQSMQFYDFKKHQGSVFLGSDPRTNRLSCTSWGLWLLGYPDQAQEKIKELLSLVEELEHPFSLALGMGSASVLYQFLNDADTAYSWAEKTRKLSTTQEFPLWLAYGTVLEGWALSEQGRTEEGQAQMHQGLDAYQATGARLLRPYYLALLAEVYGKAGEAEAGLNVLSEALSLVENGEERWYAAEIHRLKGEMLLAQAGESELESIAAEETERCFQQALEIARGQSAKSLELRAAMSLSRLWQQQDKQIEARQLLNEIYAWFSEGFDTTDLIEAKTLLDSLS